MNAPMKKIPASEAGIQVAAQGEGDNMEVINFHNITVGPERERPAVELFMPKAALTKYHEDAQEYMEEDLAKSGLSPEDIGAEVCPAYAGVSLAYRIPYYYPDSRPHPLMHRARGNTVSKQVRKYDQPGRKDIGDAAVMPYWPKGWLRNWTGHEIVNIHEGEKKAASAVKVGQVACGIGGHSNWKSPECIRQLIEQLKAMGAKNVALCPDPDILTNMLVQNGWIGLYEELTNAGFITQIQDHRSIGKFDDYICGHTLAEYYAAVIPFNVAADLMVTADWLQSNIPGLSVSAGDTKYVKNTSDNLTKIIRKLYGDRLWYNIDKQQYMFDEFVWDQDTTCLTVANEFQSRLGFNRVGRTGNVVTASLLEPVMRYVAKENAISPITNYLSALKWDGVPRLATWLTDYCHVRATPFTSEAGKRLLVAAVARAFDPGCFLRWKAILQGPQNIGKSGMWYVLAGRDNVVILSEAVSEGKDMAMVMASNWIIVDDELNKSLSRASKVKEKNLISLTEIEFRPPYGRALIKAKLRCILVGGTNDDEFLQSDPTGNNRHVVLPIDSAERFDFKLLGTMRDALWAEAVYCYQHGQEFDTVPGADEEAKRWEFQSPLVGAIASAIRKEHAQPHETRIWLKETKKSIGIQASLLEAYLIDVMGLKSVKLMDISSALQLLGFAHTRNGLRGQTDGGAEVNLRPAYVMPRSHFDIDTFDAVDDEDFSVKKLE